MVNDAERLRHDPAIRWIVGENAVSGRGASASQMGRFETKWLAVGKNLSALADLSRQWIHAVHGRRPPRGIVLDMDSSVSPTHGEQEDSVWNGHYACTCYHPLFVFNQFGDLERCTLRPGNVHSAGGWDGMLKPVVTRYQSKVSRIYFRADAGFANPDVNEFLEAERIKYAIRLPANRILQERIGPLLKRARLGGLPQDVVEAAATEFKDLVASAYFDDLAVILVGPGWPIRDMLSRRLEDTPAEARRRFARSADQLGYRIVVPGVERADPRPWR